MRISSFLPSLIAIFAAAAAAATVSPQSSSLPTPQFEPLFVAQITIDPVATLNTTGPFGVRLHGVSTGGNLTDAKTGKKVGTILPFTDVGIQGSNGVFYAQGVLPLTWDVDGHLASLSITGLGDLYAAEMQYVHAETDSPTYSWMNSNFLIISRKTVGSTGIVFTIYSLANSSSSSY